MTHLLHNIIGAAVTWWQAPARHDERGLSQSTENAVLLTGAVGVAALVIGLVTAYVRNRLGALG